MTLRVALAAIIATGFVPATPVPGQQQEPRAVMDSKSAAALATLDTFRLFEDADAWVGAVRDLSAVGKDAVPALTAKLAGGRGSGKLAATAMTLRIIDDRRAVPALIYALRRVQPKASDYGLIVPDPELHWFLWEHQTNSRAAPLRVGSGGEALSFGRTLREITAALESLTGHTEGSPHLSFYDSNAQYPKDDDVATYERTRLMSVAVADRWQAWWDANKLKLLTAEELAWVEANAPVEQFPAPPAGSKSIRLELREGRLDRALAGLDLDIWIDYERYRLKTDAQGQAMVPVPQTFQWVTITARHEGLVPVMACWGPDETLPERFAMVLPAGAGIGGMVRDNQALPISNATVYVTIGQKLGDHLWANLLDQPATTDVQGRWSRQDAPAELQACIVRVVHPEYESQPWYGSSPREAAPAVELREQRMLSVCPALTRIQGVALDGATGQPLAGATVSAIDDQFWMRSYPDVQTDAQGRFTLLGIYPRKLNLLLSKPGYAPISRTLDPPHDQRLEMRARPSGAGISRQVLGPSGKPMANAIVAVGPWQGHRLLSWHATTDADGRFNWPDPPSGPVQLRVHRTGFEIATVSVALSEPEVPITLASTLTIQGTVTDSKTGQPIDKFTLFPGYPRGRAGELLFQRERGMPGSGGAYSLTFTTRQVAPQGENRRHIRIEADGYLPFESDAFAMGQGVQTLNVQLEAAASITGIVVGPDAKPLKDATVLLATSSQWASISNGRSDSTSRDRGNVSATTDEQGRFTVPPRREEFTLIALHDSGYAEISSENFAQSPTLRVEPWGRIEITVLRGERPSSGVDVVVGQVRFAPVSPVRVSHTLSGKSDANGRIVLDRVPAGHYQAEVFSRDKEFVGLNPDATLDVKPGETVKLTLPDRSAPGDGL